MNKLTLCLLAVLLPVQLVAQDEVAGTESADAPRYTVEVIIFRYAQDVASGNELFRPEPAATDAGEDGVLEFGDERREPMPDTTSAMPTEELRPDLPDIELVLLDEADYELGDALRRLERLDAYEPLMHFGWTQTTWPQDQTQPIPLHLFARPPAELDGTLELYLSRFLHIVVDLQLRSPDTVPGEPAEPRVGSYDPDGPFGDTIVQRPVFFRIDEDRVMRSGELRYFDHPKFGMLARVAHVEGETDPDEGELLGYPVQ